MTDPLKTGTPLQAAQLRARIDLSFINAGTAGQTAPSQGLLGQDRALDAIRMAAKISHDDFNLFVLGPQGYGRNTAVRRILQDEARQRPVPSDWIYVNNFDQPGKPKAIELPAGVAVGLKEAMDGLIDALANDIPAIFESEAYQTRRSKVEQEFREANETDFNDLVEEARGNGLAVLRTPMGFVIAPVRDGKPLKAEEFEALSQAEQEDVNRKIEAANKKLEDVLKTVPRREKEHRAAVEALNKEMAERGVDEAIRPLSTQFGELNGMKSWLDAVRTDLIQNAELFLVTDSQAQAGPFPVATTKHYRKAQFRRYTVNVMVSNTQDDDIGAPVEDENLPTLANIVGRVEYASEMGALLTDFTMIKPGALHRANGGYLILDARQILSEPFAWEALKRSIKSRKIAIISPAERYGMMMTTSLEPDPIPLDVRVVLVGERILYYLLSAHDPEFPVLFKLQADFNDDVFMTPESMAGYGALVSSIAFNAGLRSPDRSGLERLMVEGTRLADDSEKLSLDLGRLSDILREADYWADGAGNGSITAQDIDRAVSEQERRAGRIRELGQEAIRRNTLLIETDGEVVGQINALSVMQIGAVAFGRPSRVTARVRMGRGKVVDIEREVELGGPLHSKGMLILSSFLASHYALDTPLSLWASIVFEQSYGGVDGDSASAAELFALLSALSEAPISQSFAVTGSVNQNGRIQAIGGVNHKIEGFFDVCADRGLTGRQGVLIPDSNVKHLALRSRVIEAVEAGRFRIIPIATIDEGITLLTGKDAGERQSGGSFPPDTINALVEKRLRGFAEKLKQFGSEEEGRNGAGKS